MKQDKYFDEVNAYRYFTDKPLKLATKKEAIEEAAIKMKLLKFPDDVIESFKEDGNLEFRMEDEIRVPLDALNRKTILLLNAVGYLVCAVFRTKDGYCSYVVSSKFKMHWKNEKKALMKDNMILVYNNQEFKMTRIEVLPGGAVKQIWPKPVINRWPYHAVSDYDTISEDKIMDIRLCADGNYVREIDNGSRPLSENETLERLFFLAYDSISLDEFTDEIQYIHAYRLTNGYMDTYSLLCDIRLMARGSIKGIISRSGLTKEEFCDKLYINSFIIDLWDSGEIECPLWYRLLMSRYLGIIREPIFIRDTYTYAAQYALLNKTPQY